MSNVGTAEVSRPSRNRLTLEAAADRGDCGRWPSNRTCECGWPFPCRHSEACPVRRPLAWSFHSCRMRSTIAQYVFSPRSRDCIIILFLINIWKRYQADSFMQTPIGVSSNLSLSLLPEASEGNFNGKIIRTMPIAGSHHAFDRGCRQRKSASLILFRDRFPDEPIRGRQSAGGPAASLLVPHSLRQKADSIRNQVFSDGGKSDP